MTKLNFIRNGTAKYERQSSGEILLRNPAATQPYQAFSRDSAGPFFGTPNSNTFAHCMGDDAGFTGITAPQHLDPAGTTGENLAVQPREAKVL